MARKSKSRNKSGGSARESDSAQAVRDSAQKIWLAGLGAFERAKSEGPRMFETLVEQGRNMGARAVGAADEALKGLRQANYSSGGKWDKLEQVFEERVSRSLNRLGVLTRNEIEELSRQVQELNAEVRNLMAGSGKPGAGRKASAASGARKTKAKAASRAKKPRAKAAAGKGAGRGSRAKQA
jgi:poly(hydroxyalkanoate) granule-associated protein